MLFPQFPNFERIYLHVAQHDPPLIVFVQCPRLRDSLDKYKNDRVGISSSVTCELFYT